MRRPNFTTFLGSLRSARRPNRASEKIFVAGGLAGPPGAAGAPGDDAGLAYSFDTSTAMADPGTGDIRFNNATIASVSELAISDTDDEANNQDGFLDTWDDSTSSIRGALILTAADGDQVVFEIDGAITDEGTWHRVPVNHLSGVLFAADEAVRVLFIRAGDEGDAGTGTPGATGGLAACRAATIANITISSALNNGDTLDGVTLATGDRVLVKNQSTAAENGIWVVGASPARATDADAAGELAGGSHVAVQEGTVNADTLWIITTNGSITPGTTAHSWALVGKVTPVNSTVEDLKIIRGVVNTTTPTIVEGAGFTLTDNGVGDVTINFSSVFGDVPAVTCDVAYTDGGSSAYQALLLTATASAARIALNTFAGGTSEGQFHFQAIGPR